MKFETLLRKAWPYLGKNDTYLVDTKKNELYIMDYLGNRYFDIDPFNLIGVSEDIHNWLKDKNVKIQIKQLFNKEWICNLYQNGFIIVGAKAYSKEFAILSAGEKFVKVSL